MKNKLKYIPTLSLTLITAVSGSFLTASFVSAESDSKKADAVVNVNDACEFESDHSHTYAYTAFNGTAGDTEAETEADFEVTCNNITGFSIKAVGFSPDATHPTGDDGNTDMYSTSSSAVIPTAAGSTTGTIPTSASSFWGMRISSANVTAPSGVTATIASPYNAAAHNYVAVPSTATTVLHYGGSTVAPVQGTFRADYGYYVSQAQPAGTYTGKVKYTIIGD